MKLSLGQVQANSWNCNYMGEIEREALKQRLNTQGPKAMEPLIVRQIPNGNYEIVDGEHRWKIAQELGWDTIEVFVLDIPDDLTAKTYCVSSSLLRGHTNWFKLATVVKQDLENGVNLLEAYKDVLSDKAIKELFSLDALVAKARLDLEEAVKKFQTITLYDLHIIAQFPAHLQEELAEEYKNHPIASHALAYTLNKYIKQTQPQTSTSTSNVPPYLTRKTIDQNGDLPSKFDTLLDPNDTLRILNARKKQQKLESNPKTTTTTPNEADNDFEGNFLAGSSCFDGVELLEGSEKFQAIPLELGFYCDCKRLYRLRLKDQLKNVALVVQNDHLIFEHIDLSPRIFLIHCNRCNNDQEVRIDPPVDGSEVVDVVAIACRHCTPVREGALDVTTGEAAWFG